MSAVSRHTAVTRLIAAVDAHLSAYSEGDEMADSDAEMAEALRQVRAAESRAANSQAGSD